VEMLKHFTAQIAPTFMRSGSRTSDD